MMEGQVLRSDLDWLQEHAVYKHYKNQRRGKLVLQKDRRHVDCLRSAYDQDPGRRSKPAFF